MAHSKPGKFKCDQCNFSCCTKPTLNGHKDKVHEKTKQVKRPLKTFQCVECSTTFHTNTKLRLHKKTEHHGEEEPAPSPPISPEHKKKKGDIDEMESEEKIDESNVKEKKEESNIQHGNYQLSQSNMRKKLKAVEDENLLFKTENSFCKNELTEWKTYGENLHKKYTAIKTSYTKLEEEHEKLGAKYIETVKELSQLKEVEMDDYSINCEDIPENEKKESKSENPKPKLHNHKDNCCAVSYGECENQPTSIHEKENHEVAKWWLANEDYNCINCGEELDNYKDLMNHRRDNHRKRTTCRYFLLGNCNFDQETCWYLHSQNIETQITCNYCEECFITTSEVMKHKKEKHREQIMPCRNKKKCVFSEVNCWFIHETQQNTENH